jgi:poly-gamma-glutamate biosynthesis protein PgsC/CapC
VIATAFALGIAFGFIFFEITGLTAGGIIVPGYIALYVDKPLAILTTILIALITFAVVSMLSRRMIIFGRRRFLLMVLAGFLFRIIFDTLRINNLEPSLDLQIIGYIIPGLIANEFTRQGIVKTILSMVIVSGLVYLLLQIIFYFQI